MPQAEVSRYLITSSARYPLSPETQALEAIAEKLRVEGEHRRRQ